MAGGGGYGMQQLGADAVRWQACVTLRLHSDCTAQAIRLTHRPSVCPTCRSGSGRWSGTTASAATIAWRGRMWTSPQRRWRRTGE